MKRIFLSLSFIIFTLCTQAQAIPLRIQPDGLFIQGKINNTATDFMFDTGAGITVISSSLFQKLKDSLIYEGPLTGFRHDGERLDGEVYSVASIAVGNFVAHQVPLLVWPELDNYGLTAILSLQPFASQPVSIDFVNKQLVIESNKTVKLLAKTADIIPIKTDRYRNWMLDIFVPLRLSDKITIDAELDTGTPLNNLLIHPDYIKQLGIDTAAMGKQVYKQLPNGQAVYDRTCTLPLIAYAGEMQLQEKNKNVNFRNGLIYPGLIGAGVFAQSKLTIDIVNNRLLVSMP